MDVTKVLDCKGLSCPEPILNIKMALGDLNSGDIVEMTATDPGSVNDMASWAKRTGNEIVDQNQEGDIYTFYVKKK
ncbi:MAG: sulfurtransferase TusA family protein [Candidatus Desulfatibia sp.]|uniref:sulfurtransferase TusA family protein n=1 Tax=Candidatus Desulfatibia sp. TaxID=3101189 RepID=UPI002F341FD9